MIPNDPIILLSFVNTKLRDYYESLEEMCENMGISRREIEEKLGRINYHYDRERNQFV